MMLRRIMLACLLLLCGTVAIADEIVINAVGDIMLAGSATPMLKRLGYDYPFAATVAELRKGNILVGNLEAPLAEAGIEFTDKRFRFKADPQAAAALKRAGFSVLTLANNHIMDFGAPALEETLLSLDRQGLLFSGAGTSLAAARAPAIVVVGEKSVAFLSYSLTYPAEFYAGLNRPGTAPGYPHYYKKDIARAKASADYVVVSFHWGTEGALTPSPYQEVTARAAVDAGADIVLGHHPHVLQGIERYKDGIIFYSLGNFAFGSIGRASVSVIARIALDEGIKRVELIPLKVNNREARFQPRPATGKEGKAVIDQLNRISPGTETLIAGSDGRYLVQMDTGRRGAQLASRQEGGNDVSLVRGNRSAGKSQGKGDADGGEAAGGTLGPAGAAPPDVALHR